MTDQNNGQILLPGPAGVAAPPAADTPRRCKRPGCGAELPATGRGAPRVFCSPACSRTWHNGNRLAAAPGPRQAAADSGPLAGLQQLLAQAAELAGAAAAQLADADPGRVTTALAAADAARRQAQAETAVAQAQAAGAVQEAQAATAAMHAARDDAQAALEAADAARADAGARAQAVSDQAQAQVTEIRRQADAAIGQARAERDAALAAASQARHHAETEVSRARQAEADARAENDHVRADAARERDAQAAACAGQLHAIQALADTWRARAEHVEQQLSLERDHQRRLDAQSRAAGSDPAGSPPAAGAISPPAKAARTAGHAQQ